MYDAGKVIIGLIIFIALVTSPIWYNIATGQPDYKPELEKPVKGENCVAETKYMRSFHMDLLNDWRDKVVREGERVWTAPDGNKYNMSLSRTCLDCHSNKEGFCDRCHDYVQVDPYCWDCHTVPKETK